MKKLILLIAVILTGMDLYPQIVIDQNDMPLAGDTLRVSQSLAAPEGYAKTAFDTTWNFAALEAMSQRVDTFVSVAATPAGYQLVFVLLGGANLAAPRNSLPLPGIPLTQGYDFFKKSSGSYSNLGMAYSVQGFPVPAKYDNPEKIYAFPMSPLSTWNSVSSFSLPVPGIAYYGSLVTRDNIVDGWGTLITPFGTFPVLRVKSTVITHDSIYIDSLQTGFTFDRNFTEYKWLGKSQGIPLLNIHEEGSLVNVSWRDIPRMSASPLAVSLGADTAVSKGTVVQLRAKTTGGMPPYRYFWNTLDSGSTLTAQILRDTSFTVIVLDGLMGMASATKKINLSYPPGMEEVGQVSLAIVPNPNDGRFTLSTPPSATPLKMILADMQGRTLWSQVFTSSRPVTRFDFPDLPEGLYLIRLNGDDYSAAGKLVINRGSNR